MTGKGSKNPKSLTEKDFPCLQKDLVKDGLKSLANIGVKLQIISAQNPTELLCQSRDIIDYVTGTGNSSREQYKRAGNPCRMHELERDIRIPLRL